MTPYSRSVVDLIRAQCKAACGRRQFGPPAPRAALNPTTGAYLAWIEALIFVPHGGEPLDARATASTYIADRVRP